MIRCRLGCPSAASYARPCDMHHDEAEFMIVRAGRQLPRIYALVSDTLKLWVKLRTSILRMRCLEAHGRNYDPCS